VNGKSKFVVRDSLLLLETYSPNSTSVVVRLKHTDLLTLQEKDSLKRTKEKWVSARNSDNLDWRRTYSVDNFVELGKVEHVGEARELLRSPDRVFGIAESVKKT
jgi:hypothetical protein